MTKSAEEKSDGLEIISIGTLYSGPWDKKYWSSSRGKDRYPYPVGYKAVRTHNGITYKMEIYEGVKGPAFLITSTDGQSCMGQTPDIAWESFQKKSFPQIKMLHGKRFSCKMDGVEFFGFKNAFVQRLLRELVANLCGTAERTCLPSNLGNEDSRTKVDAQCAESCASPDMLPYMDRPQVKGKRNRKHRPMTLNLIDAAGPKNLQHKDKAHINAISESIQGTQHYLNTGTSSNKVHDIHNNSGALAASAVLQTVGGGQNKLPSTEDSLPLESNPCSCVVQAELPPQKESRLFNSEICLATGIAGNLSVDDKLLDRSKYVKEGLSFPMEAESKDGEGPLFNNTQNSIEMDLCAPDTLDISQENIADSQPNIQSGNSCHDKCELIAGNVMISEGLVTETQPEVGTLSESSEKSDFDSVGQEIAKSMMTVLLPRALPLLKTFSRKKKRIMNQSHISPCPENSQKENEIVHPTGMHAEISHLHRKENQKMCISNIGRGSVFPISEQDASVVPECVMNDQSCSDIAEAGLAAINGNNSICDTLVLPICVNRVGCMSSPKNICDTSNDNMCRIPDEEDLKISPDFVEGMIEDELTGSGSHCQTSSKETSVDAVESVVGYAAFTEISNAAMSKGQPSGPLTESIVFRNSADCSTCDAHAATNIFVASDIQPAGSFDLNPYKRGTSGVDTMLEAWSYCVHIDKNSSTPDAVLDDMASFVSKSEALVCLSDGKRNMNCLDASASCTKKSQVCMDENLLMHQHCFNVSDSVTRLQKQEINFSAYNSEVAGSPGLKPQSDMGFNYESGSAVNFVGCYSLPLPISLVLLSTKENEISVCVLTGFLVDKHKTLFMYKISLEEQMFGCPSLIGYAPILLPLSRDSFGREIGQGRSSLQFTPDGNCLVFLNSIQAPYCRKGEIQCPCAACRHKCFENNMVNIVQVKHGYVSVVVNLKAADNMYCILVCEPNYLVGIGESGRLHLWIMNSTWSAQIEECDLLTSDCIYPCIVELRRIPNCTALVLGHNGFEEFGLWNIQDRIFLARFSFPSSSVFHFLPVSLIRWEREGSVFTESKVKEQIAEIMAATERSFSEQNGNCRFIPKQGDNLAIWVLVSTTSNSNGQNDFQSTDQKTPQNGTWRLALLIKNQVILGSALDTRTAAIGTSAGHGIIGTLDGLVYVWELSTGTKLYNLHHFQGVGVSCIATDDSKLGPLAVASECKLLVYLRTQRGLFPK